MGGPHASTCPPTSELWESSSSPASTSVHLALSAPFWVRMPSAMTHLIRVRVRVRVGVKVGVRVGALVGVGVRVKS